MEQCASATGIPLAALKLAKRGGCLFVRHGRVHLAEFIKWFFTREEDEEESEGGVDWSKRDKRAGALIKEVKLEEAKDRVIDWALAERFVNYLVGVSFFSELERLANEFPANLKGKNEIEIHAECARQIGQIKKSIESSVRTWNEKKGKI